MRPKIFTWDGNAINDGTNYEAWFEGDVFFRQADGKPNLLDRSDAPPVLASKSRQAKILTLHIVSRSSVTQFHAAYDELNGWFDTYDERERMLIVEDEADSDKQWYVYASPVSVPRIRPDGYLVDLLVTDPIWRAISSATDTWNVTASGQTHDVSVSGNRPVKPLITIKATATKTGGFAYKMVRVWRNPLTDRGNNEFLDLTNAAWNTASLVNDTSISNQINHGGGYDADDLEFNIDTAVGGGLPTGGGLCYVASTGEQIRYTGISGGVMTVHPNGRGYGGTTASAIADDAVLSFSHMLANGNDIQVFKNGQAVPRWLSGMNTANTKVWVARPDFSPGLSVTLGEAIANSGNVSEVAVKRSVANRFALIEFEKKMGGGPLYFAIGSEIFSCTFVNTWTFTLEGTVERAQLTSSMAAHAVDDPIYWLEHVWEIAYGNPAALTPVQDDSEKPIVSLSSSTNTSLAWTEFRDLDGLRAGSWNVEAVAGRAPIYYSGTHGTEADPATELGLSGNVYNQAGAPRADSYEINARIYHPAGFTHVTSSGDKYRYSTDFATVAGLYKNNDNAFPTLVWNETTPGSAQSWTAWTRSSVSLSGTYNTLIFKLKGNVLARAGNVHFFEIQAVTGTLNSSNVPQLVFAGAEISCYEFGSLGEAKPARLTNNATGDYIEILFAGEQGYELQIDCEAETVTWEKDGSRADHALDYPPRSHILTIDPRLGENEFQWDDPGTTGVTITFTTNDRNV